MHVAKCWHQKKKKETSIDGRFVNVFHLWDSVLDQHYVLLKSKHQCGSSNYQTNNQMFFGKHPHPQTHAQNKLIHIRQLIKITDTIRLPAFSHNTCLQNKCLNLYLCVILHMHVLLIVHQSTFGSPNGYYDVQMSFCRKADRGDWRVLKSCDN